MASENNETKEKNDYCIREFEIDDERCLELYQIIEGQVSAVVWDASIVLAKYLILQTQNNAKFMQDKKCLELGAGLGLCGMVAAVLGAGFVQMTDLKDAIPLLEHNVNQNKEKFSEKCKIQVSDLTWSKEDATKLCEETTFDYVFISDCIYYEESIDPLIETLTALTSNGSTKIYLAQELRESQKQIDIFKNFLKKAREFLVFHEISPADQDPDYHCEEIMLYYCVKK